MLSKRPNPAKGAGADFAARVLSAGLFTAIVESAFLLFRAPEYFSALELSLGAVAELLIDWGSLTVLGMAATAPFSLAFSSEAVIDFLGKPWKLVFNIISKPSGSGISPERVGGTVGGIKGAALFFGLLFAGAFYVLKSFHEPARMSLMIAGLGVLALLFSRELERIAVSKFIVPFFKRNERRGDILVRAAIIFLGLLILGAAVISVIFEDEIFGATQLSAPVAIGMFAAALSLACAIELSFFRFLSGKKRIALIGAAGFVIGMGIVANSEGARGAIVGSGLFASKIYTKIDKVLDFDGDGSAWLLGKDCRPLDPEAGPFAGEVPGNGYDENCDGLDYIAPVDEYVDPLGKIPPDSNLLKKPRGNVLFVIVDAARADHLPIYGYGRKTMPSLTAFAEESAVFENSFAVSNHTSVSMPSLLTGLYPSSFSEARDVNWGSFGLSKKANSIQLRMRRSGYDTILYAGHNLWGFVKDFRFSNKDRNSLVNAQDLSGMALEHLKKLGPNPDKPALFFIHFIDPHHPYKAPSEPYRYGSSSLDKYDAELSYVDEYLSPILDLMRTKGYSDWLVIVTSDHGEAFDEHGTPHHGYSLYDEEVRVPLVIRVPGARPASIAMPVSHMDLVPTILQWTGAEPDSSLAGKSVLPLLSSNKLAGSRRIVFSEFFRSGDRFGAFDGRYSLLYRKIGDTYELYDRMSDPKQKNNLYGKALNPVLETALKKHIRASTERPPIQ